MNFGIAIAFRPRAFKAFRFESGRGYYEHKRIMSIIEEKVIILDRTEVPEDISAAMVEYCENYINGCYLEFYGWDNRTDSMPELCPTLVIEKYIENNHSDYTGLRAKMDEAEKKLDAGEIELRDYPNVPNAKILLYMWW